MFQSIIISNQYILIIETNLCTLGSEINVPPGINVPLGTFDKKNKRAPWKINFLGYKNCNFVVYGSYFIQKMHFF